MKCKVVFRCGCSFIADAYDDLGEETACPTHGVQPIVRMESWNNLSDERCLNCDRSFEEHVNGRCPVNFRDLPAVKLAMATFDEGRLKDLRELERMWQL